MSTSFLIADEIQDALHPNKSAAPAQVMLDNELPFSDFIDPYSVTEIVSSRSFRDGQWRNLTRLRGFSEGVDKVVLPVDISRFRIMVVTHVEPGRHIKLHRHDDEPIFRYISHGSFHLNGEYFEAGDWVLVPIGHAYEIHTDEGYTTVAGYGAACGTDGGGGGDQL